MDASERFTAEAAGRLRDEIEENGGNEVFAAGRLDAEGRIGEILVVARGTKSAVPALAPYIERGDVIVHNHPSGTLRPSDADVGIAAEAGSAGVGSYIVDNAVERVHVVAEPARRRSLVLLDPDEISGVLEEGGKLSTLIPNYESRKSQVRLTRDVTEALNEGKVLAAEAGTGVGKSFAYLVPAFAWAIRNEERVVVSTATINLQKQLVDKDIPVVQRLFRKKTKAVLVKGRGNYLCRIRLGEALDEEGLLAGDDHPLRALAAWAETSPTGDRADLSFFAEDRLWSRVASDSESCLHLKCPHREKCFVLRVRREAADAQVIVANHHILFSDLSMRLKGAGYEQTAVLPAFRVLVMDEAHSIESSATSFFSDELTRFALNRRLSRITRRKGDRGFGVLPRLLALPGMPAAKLESLPAALAAARKAMDALDDRAVLLLGPGPALGAEAMAPGPGAQARGGRAERSYRLTARTAELEASLLRPMAELERRILGCTELLGEALDQVPEALAQERAVYEARLSMWNLEELAALCARFKDFERSPETVFWLEKGRTGQGETFLRYVATPLDITGTMDEAVFTKFRSVVCASATLSVGESFDFWKGRVGLAAASSKVETAVYPSPFPFKTNALLAVDTQAPPPESPAYRDYVDRAVPVLLEASQGRALVLFTSYEAMRSSYEAAKPKLAELGITGLKQGEDERSKLLEAFKADISSVLFATDSFWEGIDAPGETLSLVVICKLPFRVPSDPIQLARSEAVERRGGNAFMEISLPEAVIRLKQGFGRLIRHSEDRGAVVILDSRIATKRYGNLFVQSLPECRLLAEGLPAIAKEVRKFLFDW
ncbi:MAG TPA: helicase C-terminal domain-containing protein [Spirochaetales bacterium]|nr:helicase C-terminal domain-containing protein [Spirochaetales bacterium]HRY53552.1 helicase C-terminal domain-containing protein [Spirochaetia bacterium]HRZ63373.1 helicase C-terminal domain-containing protein [Spirochaetia bacterium]